METSSPPQRARAHHGALPSPQVTNAQFPEQMETLRPCTQLYISVDAPTATELKAVDRPLFADFWERFLKCVDLLREKHPACKCSPRRPTPLPTGATDEYTEALSTADAPKHAPLSASIHAGTLIATDDLPCMPVLTTARSVPSTRPRRSMAAPQSL